MIELFPFILITILLLIYYLNTRQKKNAAYNLAIDKEIAAKQNTLHTLSQTIENREIDSSVNLTKTQIDVLNIYETSHIRIPQDIIEDLAYSDIHDYQDILSYIENQRNYWKLENTKKPFKRTS